MINHPIPLYVLKYFWGDKLDELDLQRNSTYIIQTLLEKGDEKAIQWLFSSIEVSVIKKFLPMIRLSKKSAQFWNLYLS